MIHMYKIVIVELRPPLAWWVILHIIKMSCCASFDLISTKVETPSHGFPRIVTLRAPKEWDLFSNHSGQLKYILKSQSTPLAKKPLQSQKRRKKSWKIVYILAKQCRSPFNLTIFFCSETRFARILFNFWKLKLWRQNINFQPLCTSPSFYIFHAFAAALSIYTMWQPYHLWHIHVNKQYVFLTIISVLFLSVQLFMCSGFSFPRRFWNTIVFN